jgi:hypothetical protein
MRKTFVLVTGIAGLFLLAFINPTIAADEGKAEGKKMSITGTGKCGKCALHETEKCQNVIEVEKGGKTTKYYVVQNDVAKEFHSNVCKEAKKVKAEGTVKEVDGKHEFTATKITVADEK